MSGMPAMVGVFQAGHVLQEPDPVETDTQIGRVFSQLLSNFSNRRSSSFEKEQIHLRVSLNY